MAADLYIPSPSVSPVQQHGGQESLLTLGWRQRWLILSCLIVAVAGGLVYLSLVPKTYLTEAKFQVNRAVPTNPATINGTDDGSAADKLGFLNTQTAVVRSTPVISKALGGTEPLYELSFFNRQKNAIAYLKRNLEVAPEKDTDSIIIVGLRTPEPDEAKQIVNAVVQAYIETRGQQKQSAAALMREQLVREREALDRERTAKQADRSAITSSGDAGGNTALLRLTDLSNSLSRAEQDKLAKKVQFEETLRDLGWDPDNYDEEQLASGVGISSGNVDVVQKSIFALQQRLNDAKKRYLPNHPAVRAIENDLQSMRIGLAAAQRSALRNAEQSESSVRNAFETERAAVKAVNTQTALAAQLENDLRRIDSRLSSVDEQIRSLGNLVETPILTAVMIEAAETDMEGSKSPNPGKTLGIAAAAGLVLGTLMGLLREWTDPRLRSTEQITGALGLPVIGTLPRLDGQRTPEMVGWITHLEAESDAAEAYRSVRTSLLFGGVNGQEPRTILVTSPAARDGRSALASNLAISLAQAGKRVIVVDASSREPVLHRIFDVNDEPGFSGVLSGGESLESAIRRTAIEHLDVLPAGPRLRRSSEVLNSPKLAEVISYLTDRYDHVIFDGPPVNGGADARIIAAAVDQTVLIVRGDRINRQLLVATRDALLSVGAQMAGVVVSGHAPGTSLSYAYGNTPVRPRLAPNRRESAGDLVKARDERRV